MDENLVNRLRSLTGIIPQKHTLPSGADTVICSLEAFMQIKELAKDAADAIEELSKLADAIPHVCECCIGCEVESGGCDRGFVLSPKRAKEYLNKSRWIPVTERLPKDEKDVLAYYGYKHDGVLSDQRFIGTLCYFRFDPNPHWQHEGQGKLTVTHWMPLPEPPKEGEA